MAFSRGPNVVRDGLVLMLDAANPKSFRGEPTTNLLGEVLSQSGWTGSYSLVDSITKTFDLSVTYSTSASAWRTFYFDVSSYIGQYITISCNYEFLLESNALFSNFTIGQGNTGTYPLHIAGSDSNDKITITSKESQYLSWSGIINATGIVGFTIWIGSATTNGIVTCRVSNVQIENKDHATHFVNGTRGTTVATGGGWKDLSGLGNHGELINNPTWDSENGGSLVFNGNNNTTYDTGGYIDITNSSSLNNLTEFTLSFCIYSYGAQSSNGASVFHKGNETNTGFICEPYGGDIRVNYGDGSAWYWTRFLTPLTHNTYSIFDYVYDSISLKIYKNGVLQSSNNITISWDNTNLIRIGRRRGHLNHYLYGKLPYERFYNKALSQSEIQQNFNALRTRFGI